MAAAARMELWQGNGSTVRMANLYANTPMAAAATAQLGNSTVGEYFAAGNEGRQLRGVHVPPAKAMAELGGVRVFLNPLFISPFADALMDHATTIVHEALHNLTRRVDGQIPDAATIKKECF